MALRELRSKFEALKDMKKEQETKVHYHETKIQNMVTGYLIWARSFFSFAINSQISMSFNCKDWWLIIASTPSTFLYLLLFLDASATFFRTHHQLGVCQQILLIQNQDDDVEAGESIDGFPDFSFHEKMLMLDHFSTTVEKKIYIFLTVCALLAITAIELYASKCLFCN